MSDRSAVQDDNEPESFLEEAFLLYRDAGLRLPAVPRELVDSLEEQAEWQYATAPDADLTDRTGFLAEAADMRAGAAVAFGHTGHGQASWYLCYQLIRGPLAVFVRQRYGSPYDDDEIGRMMVNATAEGIEDLVVVADEGRESGRLGAGQRLVVVVDDVDGSGWEVLGGTSGWQTSDTPVAAATAFLSEG